MKHLMVNELVRTISGEVGSIPQGSFVNLLRLQGCNLNCKWCDSPGSQSLKGGTLMQTDHLAKVLDNGLPILITGGEPYLQVQALEELVSRLRKGKPKRIQIETNGSRILSDFLLKTCSHVVDFKMGMIENMQFEELRKLPYGDDYIKFLLNDEKQIPYFHELVANISLWIGYPAKISVSCTEIEIYKEVASLILDNGLPVMLNVQIHKLLGLS